MEILMRAVRFHEFGGPEVMSARFVIGKALLVP